MCNQANVAYECYDFSLELYQQLPEIYQDIDNWCITNNIEPDILEQIQVWATHRVQAILNNNPDTIFALALLSTWSIPITELLCRTIRSMSDNMIVLGGQGLADQNWVEQNHQQELFDYYFVNEVEITWPAFLQGQRNLPGINNFNFEQIDDLNTHYVIPDYRNLLSKYQYPYLEDTPELFITASRGCVRRCGYCDIGHQWKKYRYRDANHVAQEMITQFERHGIKNFFFTDSLINGSMKMLNELCDYLIEYKQQHPESDFKFKGQYIFRPKEQVKEIQIARMKQAGLDYIIVGLETGSDRIRFDMDKKHTNDDAEYFFEMFKRYGIRCHLLMITGWVTETIEDHQQTLAMFQRWQKYVASGTITGIELGSTLTILEHSPIAQRINELGISFLGNKSYLWESSKNPDLTVNERVRRRIETHKEAMKYQWPITRSLYRLNTIKQHYIEACQLKKTRQRSIPILAV
jgi:histidinol phosphatase-like PHP family hydrolase